MIEELKGILQLLKTGQTKKEGFTTFEWLKFILKLISILFVSYIFIMGIFKLCDYYGLDIPRPDKFDKTKDWSSIKLFFAAVIIAPVLEELTFRLPLRYSKAYISILFGFFIALIFRLIIDFEFEKTIGFLISAISGILFYNYFTKNGFKLIQRFWKNNPLFILYFFLLSFGFVHLSNHTEITLHLLLLSPLIVLPKIAASIIFSYARLKSGIGSSIALHMINNGIAIIFVLLNR